MIYHRSTRGFIGTIFLAILLVCVVVEASEKQWVSVGDAMPDFTLKSYQGETVSLSDYKGRNVMLMFPRGYAYEGGWCHFCFYRHAQLFARQSVGNIPEHLDLQILYVFPYDKGSIENWIAALPSALKSVDDMKNPSDYGELDEGMKKFVDIIRKVAPEAITLPEGEEAPTPFPLLLDEERNVSNRFGLFQTEWSGSKVDQNIPAVYLIDREGILRFKYISQHTFDRPSFDYLFEIFSLWEKSD
ncbi:MAG: peroxiredoxin family protein [Bacteroidales bacterium]|nr:peroxiredoxin family protein [Candidatus Latescibacterota bacterium]